MTSKAQAHLDQAIRCLELVRNLLDKDPGVWPRFTVAAADEAVEWARKLTEATPTDPSVNDISRPVIGGSVGSQPTKPASKPKVELSDDEAADILGDAVKELRP